MTIQTIGRSACKVGSRVLTLVLAAALGAWVVMPGMANAQQREQDLVDKSRMVLEQFHKENSAFRDHVRSAKAIFIVPQILRGAFIFGGAGGSGVLIAREGSGWSQPAFYNMGSASFGLQIGADASALILLVRTNRGLESFYTHNFQLGGDLSVAVLPVGGGAKGGGLTADFLSFTKAKGAYAGVSVEGSGISVADEANENYYGKPVRPVDILVKAGVSNPGSRALGVSAAGLGK